MSRSPRKTSQSPPVRAREADPENLLPQARAEKGPQEREREGEYTGLPLLSPPTGNLYAFFARA